MNEIELLKIKNDKLLSSLIELISLKEFASEHTIVYRPKTFDSFESQKEYEERKPKAWDAARKAVYFCKDN